MEFDHGAARARVDGFHDGARLAVQLRGGETAERHAGALVAGREGVVADLDAVADDDFAAKQVAGRGVGRRRKRLARARDEVVHPIDDLARRSATWILDVPRHDQTLARLDESETEAAAARHDRLDRTHTDALGAPLLLLLLERLAELGVAGDLEADVPIHLEPIELGAHDAGVDHERKLPCRHKWAFIPTGPGHAKHLGRRMLIVWHSVTGSVATLMFEA
mmetsp:Transcript_28404/g.96760  ORF Transcript_28404/g.96760 Transcript_28404/m.96760 type:complete len:221 (-) Transcript_28404:64-726(-)